MDKQYHSTDIENATLILPEIFKERHMINYFGGKKLGGYLVIHGHKKLDKNTTDYYRKNIDYRHVIKIHTLFRPMIRIHALESIVPQLIDKN